MARHPSLAACLERHARTKAHGIAVADPTGALTYAELAERVRDQAGRLARGGLNAVSDRGTTVVGIACAEDVPHLVLCLALAELGATSCTVPSHGSPQQRRGLLEKVGAAYVVHGDGSVERFDTGAADAPDPILGTEAGAKLLFSTSGTTGEPKIVCHRDAGLVAQAPRHVGAEERFACSASMEHNFAKRHRLYCVAQGATNVFLDAAGASLVEECLAIELTTLHLSAYQAHELLGAPGVEGALGHLRLKLGGSHVPASLREALRQRVTNHLQCGYGTTETGAIAFTDPRDGQAGESVGQALVGIDVRVTDPDRRPVEPGKHGEPGELAIRCEGMFLGYLGQPRLTAERLDDGWFYTGDVGRLDERFRIHLGGRSDDMFVFNSLNIHPQDLEAQILAHPGVVDAVVLPQPSPVHGDIPVALVVFGDADAPDLRELKRFVRERTGVRCPKRFTAVDRIPRNGAGKVLRDAARGLLEAERAR